jgi:hypothetical protein
VFSEKSGFKKTEYKNSIKNWQNFYPSTPVPRTGALQVIIGRKTRFLGGFLLIFGHNLPHIKSFPERHVHIPYNNYFNNYYYMKYIKLLFYVFLFLYKEIKL